MAERLISDIHQSFARMSTLCHFKVGTSPVLFSSPVSVSVIARIRDTLDHLV